MTPPPQNRSGTGFVNLQKYLSANQNNQLGNSIGQNIQNTANKANSGFSGIKSGFQQDVNKSLLSDEDRNARDTTLNQVVGGQNVDVSDDAAKNFEKYRTGAYNGPQNIESSKYGKEYDQSVGAANEAQQLGQDTKTQGGREHLLQTFIKGPNYGSGQRTLDSLFLNGQGGNALGQARKQTLGLQNKGTEIGKQAQGAADLVRSQNTQFGQETRNKLGVDESGNIQKDTGAFGQVYNPLEAKFNALPNYQQQSQQFFQDLANPDKRLAALSNAGINKGEIQQAGGFYGADPRAYYKDTSITPVLENVANAQDYARLNALSKLSGSEQNILKDPSQYERAENLKPYDFNEAGLLKQIGDRKTTYNQEYNPAVQNIIGQLGAQSNGSFGFLEDPNVINNLLDQVDVLNKQYDQTATGAPRLGAANSASFNDRAAQYQNLQSYLQNLLSTQGTANKSKINDVITKGQS